MLVNELPGDISVEFRGLDARPRSEDRVVPDAVIVRTLPVLDTRSCRMSRRPVIG